MVLFIRRYFIIAVGLTMCYSHFDFVGQYYIVGTVFTAYWLVGKMCHFTCKMVLLLALFALHWTLFRNKAILCHHAKSKHFPTMLWIECRLYNNKNVVTWISPTLHTNLFPKLPSYIGSMSTNHSNLGHSLHIVTYFLLSRDLIDFRLYLILLRQWCHAILLRKRQKKSQRK